MTERSDRDRLKAIKLLKALAMQFENSGEIRKQNNLTVEMAKGFLLCDQAAAIRMALSYMDRHVNLETGAELNVEHKDAVGGQ